MCLPSKKLYRGASCLFCLKKWFQCQNILPSFFAHPLNAWTCAPKGHKHIAQGRAALGYVLAGLSARLRPHY